MNLFKVAQQATLLLGTIAGGSFVAGNADATTILTFGQSGGGNPIVGTESSGSTTITTTNTAVLISQIDAAVPSGTAAYLDLSLHSVSAATIFAGNIVQDYTGTFSITSGTGGTGTNYLSGSLVDVAFGSGTAFTLNASTPPSGAVTFTSSVITDLALDRGAALSFANVTPALQIVDGSIGSFTGSVSGTFSGQPPTTVPEPASLAMLGMGLFGLGMIRRRLS